MEIYISLSQATEPVSWVLLLLFIYLLRRSIPFSIAYHWVCDAWPVRRQTYGYLPSHRVSPPNGRYEFILLGEQRHMCVNDLPRVATWSVAAGTRTCDLRKSDVLTTEPPRHRKTESKRASRALVRSNLNSYIRASERFLFIVSDGLAYIL